VALTRTDLENDLLRATFRRFNPEVRVLSDEEQEASLREVLDRHEPGTDVWLFGLRLARLEPRSSITRSGA